MGTPRLVLLTYEPQAGSVKQHLTIEGKIDYTSIRAALPPNLRDQPLGDLRGLVGAATCTGNEALIVALVLEVLRHDQGSAPTATGDEGSLSR
jgi:hypothetical protein